MTHAETRALLHELDQCANLLELAESHIINGYATYAETTLAVLASGIEQLRHALDDKTCRAAVVAAIQSRPEYHRREHEPKRSR